MNVWKPIALFSVAGLVLSVGIQVASAGGGACHDQPHMAEAVEALKSARGSLTRAEHDKGGWRTAAIEATDKAIAEANRGCEMAR